MHFHVLPLKVTTRQQRKKMIQKICGTYPYFLPRFTIKVNAIEGHRQADLHLRHITKNFSHYIRVRTFTKWIFLDSFGKTKRAKKSLKNPITRSENFFLTLRTLTDSTQAKFRMKKTYEFIHQTEVQGCEKMPHKLPISLCMQNSYLSLFQEKRSHHY